MRERTDILISWSPGVSFLYVREATLVGSQFLVVFLALGLRDRIGDDAGDFTKVVGYTRRWRWRSTPYAFVDNIFPTAAPIVCRQSAPPGASGGRPALGTPAAGAASALPRRSQTWGGREPHLQGAAVPVRRLRRSRSRSTLNPRLAAWAGSARGCGARRGPRQVVEARHRTPQVVHELPLPPAHHVIISVW